MESDFYYRATDFRSKYTEIERNQQFLTIESELDGYPLLSQITNRNDWSMNPNRLDLDLSVTPDSTSVILQDQTELSQEFESNQKKGRTRLGIGAFYSDSEIKGDATRFRVFNNNEKNAIYTLRIKELRFILFIAKNYRKRLLSLGLRYR